MTNDDFRNFQKDECGPLYSKRKGKKSIYGCSCCRNIASLNLFKKLARKKAKARFKAQTRKIIKEET